MGMSKSSRKPRKCPTCQLEGTIRTIIYGMPLGPPDASKYVLGGCDFAEDSPKFHCINCDTSVLVLPNTVSNPFGTPGADPTHQTKARKVSVMSTHQKNPKYWIFQSNPQRYDLLGDLQSGSPDASWSANQHRDEMKIGDKIFFRISGSRKGIYATGSIESSPYRRTDQFGDWKVKIKFDGLIDPPILREETDKLSTLKNFRPLKGAEATNFKVPNTIGIQIEKLIQGKGRVLRKVEKGVRILPPVKKIVYKETPKKSDKRPPQTQEHIRKVEQAAIDAALKYFFKQGYALTQDCQLKGVGYDLTFEKNQKELHVEVKGVSGIAIDFNLTPKELKCAKSDARWRVLVITNALKAPEASLFTGEELLDRAKIEATQYRVQL